MMTYALKKYKNGKVKLEYHETNRYPKSVSDFYETLVDHSFINEETFSIIADYNERKVINTGISLFTIFSCLYN